MTKRRPGFLAPLIMVVALLTAVLPDAVVFDVTSAVGGFRVAACLVIAGLALAVSLLETRLIAVKAAVDGMVDTINKQIYGEDYQTIRDAVTILVSTMKKGGEGKAVARRELERLSGQSFGDDGQAWASWWEKARPTFRTQKMRPKPPE